MLFLNSDHKKKGFVTSTGIYNWSDNTFVLQLNILKLKVRSRSGQGQI